ncbi:RE1-silencing transcription factor-like isoform X1 [Achroia grisella]|uniref:RE1-silencing transcription factor-like isoform X1 n=1 Tax=Achroia grisella TaxID=688607 RepID=UPI0027D25BDC|nr:RE1-silencing transcription factor-like isoform X1 [Achroia grisella]
MEKRKESLSALKICRFCLCQDSSLSNLYDRSRKPKNAVPLSLKILSSVSIEVFPSDKMPSFICNRCRFFMDICYEYKQICHQTDETILNYVQSGTPMENMAWPSQLNKLYKSFTKSLTKEPVIKSVVEGGATVQVTSQSYDSDEEDENVYNIKIDQLEDGSEHVKLLTNKNETDFAKEKASGKGLYDEITLKKSDANRWPCNLCDCTYPLQQLLELHKVQRHRARTVPCNHCNAKFYNKHDLATHALIHSDDMPFECLACGRKFKRLILLKRHEKVLHSDLCQFSCPHCTVTFLSQEELVAHQNRHGNIANRRHVCPVCSKRFHEKNTLRRHIDIVHNKKRGLRCEYCTELFSSVSKLTRHVRSHAGKRAYPCKYCNKSFLKSHHYTRHLRVKHRHGANRTPFGDIDQYRCEQCEDTFSTQDELIYHSAIHATQNLTCPLCQEKFENVDAVTVHIKSHVNGIEFMCDLCELVFTSKEKLDLHLTTAHDEELRNSQDSSMEVDAEDEDDDNTINVKEEGDHMVVEIKKADNFMLDSTATESEAKIDNTNSEESESEATYSELSAVDTLPTVTKELPEKAAEKVPVKRTTAAVAVVPAAAVTPTTTITTVAVTSDNVKNDNKQTASILRKAEEIKRKAQQTKSETIKLPEKEKPNNKVESTNSVGASDKSLRLLEKELQDLKRTNSRNEPTKMLAKNSESFRIRRPQIHTSTPKQRVDEKKLQPSTKATIEKKIPERRIITKENKEPKETKEPKDTREPKETKEPKEAKEVKTNIIVKDNTEKELKEKEKEKDTPKNVIKNGASDKSSAEDNVRRSTRPSKIKDYAKMIRDRTQESEGDDSDMDDDEFEDKQTDNRIKVKRVKTSSKPSPVPAPSPTTVATRKRGRPRKEQSKEIPSKLKKEEAQSEEDGKEKKVELQNNKSKISPSPEKDDQNEDTSETVETESNKTTDDVETKPSSDVLVSPTGQTLKKVPIKALPPGIKPLPLPTTTRPLGAGELCEMQIGKKMVKVQKIVMTKAEVEAMAKKGLVEMKDGTMVLKQGIKLPTVDPLALKSTLVGEKDIAKESPIKKETEQCDNS